VRWFPEALSHHGLRFISLHESKQQLFVATYARGTGPVEVALPSDARRVTVHVARGFEHLPATVTTDLAGAKATLRVAMARWTNLAAHGWVSADAHVHYDRFSRGGDRDWFTMLAGDDLHSAHFMVLKGGKVPGLWAAQYGYGAGGEAHSGGRLLSAGMEYRDTAQGHINLLGMPEVVEPIMAGTGGAPNHPPLHTVLLRTRAQGGLPGAAHGGSLSSEPTVILDAVLGALDFVEIGNTHLYSLENWYRLMNGGFHLPPAAGTDLPNYPDRDPWQPFLGGMRMYVKLGGRTDFDAWKNAVRSGSVFVSSGPILSFKVNGTEMGGTVNVQRGDPVTVEAEIASPVGLRTVELIANGRPLALEPVKGAEGGVHRWRVTHQFPATESLWLAVRGEGVPIQSLHRAALSPAPWHKRDTIAHSAATRVIVDGQPIRLQADVTALMDRLRRERGFYAGKARYASDAQRQEMLALFDRALGVLEGKQ
jgi:hypothetical protein